MPGQGRETQACGSVDDADRILGILRNGDGAAAEDTADCDIRTFAGGVGVDPVRDILRLGVGHRSAGPNRHLVAADYRSEFLRIGGFGAHERYPVADGDMRIVRDEDVVRVEVVAYDESLGGHGHDGRRRHDDDRLVLQTGDFTYCVVLHVPVFVAVLADKHFGAARKGASLEDEGLLARIVLRSFAHVVAYRNRHVRDAGSRIGRDGHPGGNFRHPVGVGIDGDDLVRCSLSIEIQCAGAYQNSIRKPVLILVATPREAQNRCENRGRQIFYQSHNRVF